MAVESKAEMLGEVLTAIVTPFRADGSIDLERFRSLARHLVENGNDGVVVAGSTGESPTLSDEEKLALFATAVDEIGDRATVIAGTGTYDTRHTVHLTEKAHELGVDGFLVVTPYYSKPPPRGIVAHFEAVAAATDKPIVVYNIPGRCVINIEPATIERLAEISNVRAVKQANDDLDQARRIPGFGLDLYAGDDDLTFAFVQLGGRGVISITAHIVGTQFKEMITKYREGDLEGARAANDEIRPALDLIQVTTNPIAIKAALNMLGHEVGGLRLPLVEADEDEQARIRACLERLRLLAPVAA